MNHNIVSIATPCSIGSGVLFADKELVVTSEFVVRENNEVVFFSRKFGEMQCKVSFIDQLWGLAFLKMDNPDQCSKGKLIRFENKPAEIGEMVYAGKLEKNGTAKWVEGKVTDNMFFKNDISWYVHNADIGPEDLGGAIINKNEELLGMTVFPHGEMENLALPAKYIQEAINLFEEAGRKDGVRCVHCGAWYFAKPETTNHKCLSCSQQLSLANEWPDYEPEGVALTIERMLENMGYKIVTARRGPNAWAIEQGSAKIQLNYHEESGMISGDAALCLLPEKEDEELYRFLLKQNNKPENLTFLINQNQIFLSLIIYDSHLNLETGTKLLNRLFEQADYFDDILINTFQARHLEETDR